MPWYDHRCDDCDARFEVRRSMSEDAADATPECPECGSPETRRLFGNVFAGTGSGRGCEPSGEG